MVSRCRLSRSGDKKPLKMMVNGRLFRKVHTEQEYDDLLKGFDRKHKKVRLV
jgi:hypothetical protein